MANTFTIKQELTFLELYKASFHLFIKAKAFRRMMLIVYVPIILLSLSGLILSFTNSYVNAGSVFSFISLLFAPGIVYLIIILMSATYIYLARKEHVKNVTYTFNHWGMIKTGNGYEFTRPWRSFLKYKETSSFLFLYIGDFDAHFIQKRMFSNDDELNDFKKILTQNISIV